jgi:hypothetical protein
MFVAFLRCLKRSFRVCVLNAKGRNGEVKQDPRSPYVVIQDASISHARALNVKAVESSAIPLLTAN